MVEEGSGNGSEIGISIEECNSCTFGVKNNLLRQVPLTASSLLRKMMYATVFRSVQSQEASA